MKRLFKTFFILLTILCCLCPSAYAAKPLKSYLELKDGKHLFVKTFKASPDEDPLQLKEEPFELDGFSYSFFDLKKEEVIKEDKRNETQIRTVESQTNDISSVLQQLEPEVYYNENGYVGNLPLDHDSISTSVKGYTTQTYTVTDTITIRGLSSNDISLIPKTTVKDGITLKLTNVDWSVDSSTSIDYYSLPSSYSGVAYYSGSYTRSIPTGYITTAEYSGEVINRQVESVIYTIIYLGEEIPDFNNIEGNGNGLTIAAILLCFIVAAVAVAFFLFYYNTYIYLKKGDEYQRIGRKRIKWNNPVVDLRKFDIAGKDIAVNIKKQTANKLFGRQIKTIANDEYIVKCLVDRQNCDFWYVLSVPKRNTEPDETEKINNKEE